MERNELALLLEQRGYKQDHWGHYKKEIVSTKTADNTTKTMLHRYKMHKTSVRYEVKLGEGSNAFWHKRWSQYYCNIEIRDGNIKIKKITTKELAPEEGENHGQKD